MLNEKQAFLQISFYLTIKDQTPYRTFIDRRVGGGIFPPSICGQLLNNKTAVEQPILKLGLPNFKKSFYFIFLLVASLLFISIFKTSHMTLSSASQITNCRWSFCFIYFSFYSSFLDVFFMTSHMTL